MTITLFKPCLDLNEFIARCAPNQQAMIYGLKYCGELEIQTWLGEEQEKRRFKDIFNYSVGSNSEFHTTFEKRKIDKIKNENNNTLEICKNAQVNIVLENFKRKKIGLPIIPIVYVVDKDDFKLDINKILKRLPKKDKNDCYMNITDAEIRRAFRLCFDPSLPEDIRCLAQKTFIFISLKTNEKDDPVKYTFSIRSAPWNSKVWQNGWKKRVQQPKAPKEYVTTPWRIQVKTIIANTCEEKCENSKI
jgi:hypothetical protein